MMRAVIYARFSTDLQNERSIEDQEALCRAYASRNNLTVVDTYADCARSGSSTVNRAGWQQIMRDADARAFDVILAEDIDRISRDEADYHAARKRLAFLGIKIHTAHGGEISNIEGSVRAMMGALFLEQLAHKTRRGLAGVVAQGRHPGGRVYGYRRCAGGKPGDLEIIQDEAAIVRRIFQEYAAGRTPRDIARDLTREGIPSPRGGRWAASSINGNKQRRNGILQSEIYAGRIIWNRLRMDRNPDTGKRVSRPNPKSAWHEKEVPHLRLIDRELFDAVQKRKAERSIGHPTSHRRPRHILSGLLRCGACGGGMSVSGRDKSGRQRLYCTAWRETGSCTNPKTFYLCTVENAVLGSLRRELRHPTVMAEYAKAYIEERNRLAQKFMKDRTPLERRLATTQNELERAAKALIKGTLPEEIAEKEIAALQSERARLKAELAATPVAENAIPLHPAILARYENQLAKLQEVLAAGTAAGDTEAATAIRDLVERVTVHPDSDRRGGVMVEIVGRLNALLRGGPRANKLGSLSVGSVVAGAGIEPATYGL
jgi:site-specific DNA recombinase